VALAVAGCYSPSLPLSGDGAGAADAVAGDGGNADARRDGPAPPADGPVATGDAGAPCSVVYAPDYVDDFDDNSLPAPMDGGASSGQVDLSSGWVRLRLDAFAVGAYAHVYSLSTIDMSDVAMAVELVDGPIGDAMALFVIENGPRYGFRLQSGILTWGALGGATGAEAWDGSDRWFRIRGQGGAVLYFDVSPDGLDWRLLGALSAPGWIANGFLLLEARTVNQLSTTDDVVFDDLNSPPPCP
jgi:hypothetical protein